MIQDSEFFYVYVLRSQTDHMFYTGYTSDIRQRLHQHVAGEVESTAHRRPMELVYYEACLNRSDATRHERYLKSTWGKRYIKNRLKDYLTG
jgi:putative endonuclease